MSRRARRIRGRFRFPRVKARPAGKSCRYFKRRGGSGGDS